MAELDASPEPPEGMFSLLDMDLYKLTMQNAILQYYPDVDVSYKLTNRTAHLHLNRRAFEWLKLQIQKLRNVTMTDDEIGFLSRTCKYLSPGYIEYLKTFRFDPRRQVDLKFQPTEHDSNTGEIELRLAGRWLDTILYEVPVLALISEAYFKYVDTDWSYAGQIECAHDKTLRLLEAGCTFSEFGVRRRRDHKTQDMIIRGILSGQDEAQKRGYPGKVAGTSNVYLAMKYGLVPIGTIAHEWFMGIAAITNDYPMANELALKHWVGAYGQGVLGIALTDTFGTRDFLKAFKQKAPPQASSPSPSQTYAEIFTGTRQDSGDPLAFVDTMKSFYTSIGMRERKTVVFSDALDVDKCILYREAAERAGLNSSFGIGTHFTNDFKNISDGKKSTPMNVVIKLETAAGRLAVKLSDNLGKNMGDSAEVARVKQELGYHEVAWEGGDESKRW